MGKTEPGAGKVKTEKMKTDWSIRAVFLELMSFSFAYPDDRLVEAIVSGEYADALKEITPLMGIAVFPDALQELSGYQDKEKTLHALRSEATRLFIGAPTPLIDYYEGMWRAKDDGVEALLFVNPHSMAVERFMRSCGIGQAEGKNEPFDSISAELEFLEYLSAYEAGIIESEDDSVPPHGGWASAYAKFMEEHARIWMPGFAAAVQETTRESFYRLASQVLSKWF